LRREAHVEQQSHQALVSGTLFRAPRGVGKRRSNICGLKVGLSSQNFRLRPALGDKTHHITHSHTHAPNAWLAAPGMYAVSWLRPTKIPPKVPPPTIRCLWTLLAFIGGGSERAPWLWPDPQRI
jgi:hypothetical protein